MTRLLIIGGGELGRQVCHWAKTTGRHEITGFVDDNMATGELTDGYPVLGTIADTARLYEEGCFDEAFIAIGYIHFQKRKDIYLLLKEKGIPLATIIAPQVYVDPTARIGQGVIIYPGTVIDRETVIEDNVIINLRCVVAHNSVIGRHCFLSPNVTVVGFTEIGESCFLGCSCTIADNVKVTDNVVIGAASLIRHDIAEQGVYTGYGEKMR
jgi:sugar O-acyltransferase (sialic acid O-acetyltransferase NeuD family)